METHTDISKKIWREKYQFKKADGSPVDQALEDTWKRVARSLAAVENDSVFWEQKFYDALQGSRFLPAGRIISGAGTGRSVTLFNCFVTVSYTHLTLPTSDLV